MVIAALTLAGENLFRESCNVAGEGALHYEIWINFSEFLADGIKACDQPLPFRHTCPSCGRKLKLVPIVQESLCPVSHCRGPGVAGSCSSGAGYRGYG